MGSLHSLARVGAGILLSSFLLLSQTGCQLHAQQVSMRVLQQQVVNRTGLREVETYDVVRAIAAPPQKWDQLNVKKTALYTDMQWRSPSKQTGVGVAYIRMPLPLPSATLIWFAKQEYCKRADDGKLIGEWTDAAGRPWFEAENKKYHVRGYVITKGFEAWIVYCGYRMETPPVPEEVAVAKRSQETILPLPFAPKAQLRTAAAE